MNTRSYPIVALSLLLTISTAILLSVFTPSCTKLDASEHRSWQNRKDFFDLPANAHPALRKIAAEFERQNKLTGFVKGMVAKDGMPVWEKSLIVHRHNPNMLSRDGEESDDVIEVFTPLVLDNADVVSGFFFSKIVGDSVALHLYRASDYDKYPLGSADSSIVTAERVTVKLMELNHIVFGPRKFAVSDTLLFSGVKPRDVRDSSVMIMKGGYEEEVPNSFVSYACWYVRSGVCNCSSLPCDWNDPCPTMYCTSVYCVAIIIEPSGGGPAGWPPDPPIYTGGGGSGTPNNTPGGGNCTGTSNCGTGGSVISEGRIPCGGCGSPPIIVIPPDEPPTQPPLSDTCEQLLNFSNKMDSLYIKGKIDSMLNTFTGWQDSLNEKGFSIISDCYKVNGDTVAVNYFPSDVVTGTDSSINLTATTVWHSPVHFKLWTSTAHIHPRKGYSTPSPSDIYNNLLTNTINEPRYEGLFVIAASGDKYALTVTDRTQALAFNNTKSQYLDGIKWNESSNIGKAFNEAFRNLMLQYKSYDIETRRNLSYEMAMSIVLKQFNTGITLHKQDITGKFKPIVVLTTIPNLNKPKNKVYTRDCQ